MKTKRGLLFLAAAILLYPATGLSMTTGYIGNLSGNSADWMNAVTAAGGTVNANLNFTGHPTGNLTTDAFYSLSDGVTLSSIFSRTTGARALYTTGTGPAGGNTFSAPKSTGEGLHPSSTYLLLQSPKSVDSSSFATTTLNLVFDEPVMGFGLDIIDLYNPFGRSEVVLEAYDVDGNLLGSYTSPSYNFQKNYTYFMGLTSDANDIASVNLVQFNHGIWAGSNSTDSIGIDDIVFARTPVVTQEPVPEPLTLLGLSMGIGGLARYLRRRTR